MDKDIPKAVRESVKDNSNKKKPREMVDFIRKNSITLLLVLLVLLTTACLYLFKEGIDVGAEALTQNYKEVYESEKDASYNAFYNSAYERAKKKFQVDGTVVISIDNLEKTGKLEVLKANAVELITEGKNDNSQNVTAWLEVSGEGTFVVDLAAAEFIVDNGRRLVHVRIPYPELTNITINDAKNILFKDDWFNGSYSVGVDLALKQRNEASLRIQRSLISNQYIYESAQTVARSMITNLVKQFNSDIPNLQVDVEFID